MEKNAETTRRRTSAARSATKGILSKSGEAATPYHLEHEAAADVGKQQREASGGATKRGGAERSAMRPRQPYRVRPARSAAKMNHDAIAKTVLWSNFMARPNSVSENTMPVSSVRVRKPKPANITRN